MRDDIEIHRFQASHFLEGGPWVNLDDPGPSQWITYGDLLEEQDYSYTLRFGGKILACLGVFHGLVWASFPKNLTRGERHRALRAILSCLDYLQVVEPDYVPTMLIDSRFPSAIRLAELAGFEIVEDYGPFALAERISR